MFAEMSYDNQRHDLLGAINEVLQLHNISNLHTLVHIILFGDNIFTHNGQILEKTLKFIQSSERFL